MTYEEQAILDFLKGCPETFVARREIARKSLKRSAFDENPHWIDAPLMSLLHRGLVEQNDLGQIRIKGRELEMQ